MSPQEKNIGVVSKILVYIADPSFVSQIIMMLLSPIAAKNQSSGENVNHLTEILNPFNTAKGALPGKSHKITGASGFF